MPGLNSAELGVAVQADFEAAPHHRLLPKRSGDDVYSFHRAAHSRPPGWFNVQGSADLYIRIIGDPHAWHSIRPSRMTSSYPSTCTYNKPRRIPSVAVDQKALSGSLREGKRFSFLPGSE